MTFIQIEELENTETQQWKKLGSGKKEKLWNLSSVTTLKIHKKRKQNDHKL